MSDVQKMSDAELLPMLDNAAQHLRLNGSPDRARAVEEAARRLRSAGEWQRAVFDYYPAELSWDGTSPELMVANIREQAKAKASAVLRTKLAEVERERDAAVAKAKPRMFPIAAPMTRKTAVPHPTTIPWEIADLAYSAYRAKFGSGQSLERLAERGGFYAEEMDTLLPDWRERCSAMHAAAAERERLEKFLRSACSGGRIVSTNDLTVLQIADADAQKRMLVLDDGLGFVMLPWGLTTGHDQQRAGLCGAVDRAALTPHPDGGETPPPPVPA